MLRKIIGERKATANIKQEKEKSVEDLKRLVKTRSSFYDRLMHTLEAKSIEDKCIEKYKV